MTNDRFIEIEHRLAFAEREVAEARAEVRAWQNRERPRSRLRRDGMLGLLGLVLMFAVARTLVTEAQGARPQVLTVRAPFKVMDASGKKVLLDFTEYGNGIGLQIGDPSSAGVMIGVGVTGEGIVNVRTKAGTRGTLISSSPTQGPGVFVFAPDGKTIVGSLALGPGKKGELEIGAASSGRSHIGVGESGAGYVAVYRADGKRGISLGQFEGRPMSVSVFGDKEKELVSLRTDEKGGRVQVWTATGAAVAGLFAGDTGGGLALTGPAGGKSAVSLSVASTGGKVRVFPPAGGSASAELTAESSGGAFTVYTSTGEPVALLQATSVGAGRLEISRAGQIYVEAGVLPGGVGVVRAGPQIGGPLVGGQGIPFAIVGRKGK